MEFCKDHAWASDHPCGGSKAAAPADPAMGRSVSAPQLAKQQPGVLVSAASRAAAAGVAAVAAPAKAARARSPRRTRRA